MRFFLLVLLTLVLAAQPVSAQPPRSKDRLEDSVSRALEFLKVMQEKDGSWQLNGTKNHATTALAVMAYLSAGHLPGEGPYGDVIEKGVRWVLKNQTDAGLFATDAYEMYQHGIATLMLAEVYGMTDASLARQLKPKLEKGLKVILQAQKTEPNQHRGGWRYTVTSGDADLSITGWQVLALKAARNIGCDVPAERIDLAVDYVLRCRDSSTGAFCYTPFGRATNACTGIGILVLEIAGGKEQRHHREALQGGGYLLKQGLQYNSEHFFYTVYYSSQALFQLGHNYWNFFRPQMHKVLFDNQQPNGSWLSSEGYGPIYGTAMGVLALTVEYRFLPIYQRNEEAGMEK